MQIETYKKIALWPLTILSFIFLWGYLAESFDFNIALENPRFFSVLNISLWLVFALDYLVMLTLSKNKSEFFKTHLIDLVLVLIPFLRPLRALRILLMFERVITGIQNKIYVSIPLYVVSAATLIVLLAGGAIYEAEGQIQDSNIKSPEDALWWAAVTVTTVGYGDKCPISSEGRWIAVGLMITGIAVVGSITASLAAWIVQKVNSSK
jgi:voltage-gated potassium channel